MEPNTDTERFRSTFASAYPDVVRFAARRAGPERAEDVAADAFLVAWRRVAELPHEPDAARAWLFGIARNQLLNERRGERRRDALAVRLADHATLVARDGADAAAQRVDLAVAWQKLTDADQEVLALTVFEQLTSEAAATVLGTSPGAYRVRLSRARAALRHHLGDTPATASLEGVSR